MEECLTNIHSVFEGAHHPYGKNLIQFDGKRRKGNLTKDAVQAVQTEVSP